MFEIKGNSGCIIDLVKINNILYIEKYSNRKEYFSRLEKQFEKQNNFFNKIYNKNLKINCPKVFDFMKNDNKASFKMEYINSPNMLDFLYLSKQSELYSFIKIIMNFLDSSIEKCSYQYLDKDIFYSKHHEIMDKLKNHNSLSIERNNNINKKLLGLINKSFNTKLPVGYSHGDLTFSNIFYDAKKNELQLIDFLDTFYESPLQDIVKIRQDTKYLWILNFSENIELDKYLKIKNVLQFLDKEFIDLFSDKYRFYSFHYKLFQAFNLARLLPYINDDLLFSKIYFDIMRI